MKDIFDSFSEWLQERHNSAIYGVYLAAFIVWNWRAFYALFFEDESLLQGTTALSYAQSVSNRISHLNTGMILIDNKFVLFFLNEILIFGFPLLITYVAIWWVPYLNNWAHARQLKFYFERRQLFDAKKTEYQRQKTENLEEYKEATKEQTKVLEEIVSESAKRQEVEETIASNSYTREATWALEYEAQKDSYRHNKALKSISKMIYEDGGKLIDKWGNRSIDTDDLAYADTGGLLELKKNSADIYQLTAKGKYFLKRLFEK